MFGKEGEYRGRTGPKLRNLIGQSTPQDGNESLESARRFVSADISLWGKALRGHPCKGMFLGEKSVQHAYFPSSYTMFICSVLVLPHGVVTLLYIIMDSITHIFRSRIHDTTTAPTVLIGS